MASPHMRALAIRLGRGDDGWCRAGEVPQSFRAPLLAPWGLSQLCLGFPGRGGWADPDKQTQGCRSSSPNPHLPPGASCHRWHSWVCEMTALLSKDSSALSCFKCAKPRAIYSIFSSVSEWLSESFHLRFRWEVQHLAVLFESVCAPVHVCRGG